jgi:hypothetical protein
MTSRLAPTEDKIFAQPPTRNPDMANGRDDLDERYPMVNSVLNIGLPGFHPPEHIQREILMEVITQLKEHMRKALDEKPGIEGAMDCHRLLIRAHDILVDHAFPPPQFGEPPMELLIPDIEELRATFHKTTRLARRIVIWKTFRETNEERLAEYRETLRMIRRHPNYNPVEFAEDVEITKRALADKSVRLSEGLH